MPHQATLTCTPISQRLRQDSNALGLGLFFLHRRSMPTQSWQALRIAHAGRSCNKCGHSILFSAQQISKIAGRLGLDDHRSLLGRHDTSRSYCFVGNFRHLAVSDMLDSPTELLRRNCNCTLCELLLCFCMFVKLFHPTTFCDLEGLLVYRPSW